MIKANNDLYLTRAYITLVTSRNIDLIHYPNSFYHYLDIGFYDCLNNLHKTAIFE